MGNLASRDVFGNKTGPNTGTGLDTLAKNQGAVREGVGMLPPKEVTILDGAISGFEEAALIVDTEGGGAADDLEVISPVISATENLHPGMLITLRAKDPARVVTVKNSASANGINTADGNDIVLSPDWELTLRLVGGRWYEVRGRSGALADAAMSAAAGAQSTANAAKAVTDTVTPAPTANAVPQADANGRLLDGWLLLAAPPGFSGFYAGNTPPDGWFEENGAAVSRTTYARLFTIIGTSFGAGNGSTTFNLPDSRALVKRVWDHGRGIDTGRTLGSVQQDSIKSHNHELGGGHNNLAVTASPNVNDVGRTEATLHSSYYTAATGGPENIMKNMSFMGIIKY